MTIGGQNVTIAKKIMKNAMLQIQAEDVGGERGRKIFFCTHTGELLLKRLNNRH